MMIEQYAYKIESPGIYWIYARVEGLPSHASAKHHLTLLVDGEVVAKAYDRLASFAGCVWRVKRGDVSVLVHSSQHVDPDSLKVSWEVKRLDLLAPVMSNDDLTPEEIELIMAIREREENGDGE